MAGRAGPREPVSTYPYLTPPASIYPARIVWAARGFKVRAGWVRRARVGSSKNSFVLEIKGLGRVWVWRARDGGKGWDGKDGFQKIGPFRKSLL